jgi:hypothetical protein
VSGAVWPPPERPQSNLKGWLAGLVAMSAYAGLVAVFGKAAMSVAGVPDLLSWREALGGALGLAWVRVVDRVMFRGV